jgi:hypothetical protein
MRHDDPRHRRPGKTNPSWEALESRRLMTGGAGSIFAIIPGEIAAPGGQVEVKTAIDPSNVTMPKGKIYLGIDIAPSSGSAVRPRVQGVVGDANVQVRGLMRSLYAPFIKDDQVVTNAPASAVVVPLTRLPGTEESAITLTTRVAADEQTAGKFLAGYYLPGDANGDGKVNLNDRETVRSALGAIAGQSSYQFDADANRDGKISGIDLMIATANQGAETNVRPIITANLHPESDSGTADRRTVYRDVTFTGEATPGAVITFTDPAGKAPAVTATASADGKYAIRVSLVPGENTFEVGSRDPFGQEIRGAIAPVTYLPPLVPVESPMPPQPAGQVNPTPTTPPPSGTTEAGAAQFRALEQRFPNAIKRLTPDQAENLRKMLASKHSA